MAFQFGNFAANPASILNIYVYYIWFSHIFIGLPIRITICRSFSNISKKLIEDCQLRMLTTKSGPWSTARSPKKSCWKRIPSCRRRISLWRTFRDLSEKIWKNEWMVSIWENPIQTDDLGIFWGTHHLWKPPYIDVSSGCDPPLLRLMKTICSVDDSRAHMFFEGKLNRADFGIGLWLRGGMTFKCARRTGSNPHGIPRVFTAKSLGSVDLHDMGRSWCILDVTGQCFEVLECGATRHASFTGIPWNPIG